MTKVIVTGGAGFIGSHATDELISKGYEVFIIDDLSSGKKENLNSQAKFYEIDIRSDKISGLFARIKPDYVLHFAAKCSVPASLLNPELFNDVNINGTLNILKAAKESGVKRVVFSSSSSVYGDSPTMPQKEGQEGEPKSPYAITKLAGEKYCKFFNQIGLETVCLRYFNVFGPRQKPDSQYAAVIPKFIKSIFESQQPTIFGDGEQTRDFTYVANVVNANINAMTAKGAAGEVFNIANGTPTSVNALVDKINAYIHKNIQPIYLPVRQGDIVHSCADNSKAMRMLNYQNLIDFEAGIQKTVDWFKSAKQ